MIAIDGLEKRFGPLEVLRGVDLTVLGGRVTAIVGPNGAGKTTLIKSILGLARPDVGRILIDGHLVGDDPAYRARIGYMPQIARFPENLTGRELLAMVASLRGGDVVRDEELLERFALREQLDRPLRTLSGGTRQKVNAVLAFLFAPRLLILDEPTTGLDPASSATLKDKIASARRAGAGVVLTSHVMSELEELADDVAFLLDGRIRYAGPVRQLKFETRQFTLERAIARLMSEEAA